VPDRQLFSFINRVAKESDSISLMLFKRVSLERIQNVPTPKPFA